MSASGFIGLSLPNTIQTGVFVTTQPIAWVLGPFRGEFSRFLKEYEANVERLGGTQGLCEAYRGGNCSPGNSLDKS